MFIGQCARGSGNLSNIPVYMYYYPHAQSLLFLKIDGTIILLLFAT